MIMLRKLVIGFLFVSIAHAEDMIDPNLITPIDCPTPVVKLEPKIVPITNFGYQSTRSSYSLNTVHVGTYVLVDVDGVLYRKYMVFSNNQWDDVLIKE